MQHVFGDHSHATSSATDSDMVESIRLEHVSRSGERTPSHCTTPSNSGKFIYSSFKKKEYIYIYIPSEVIKSKS